MSRTAQKKPRREKAAARFTPSDTSNARWTSVGVCVFLAAIVWAAFGQILHYGFTNFDDGPYVYENPEVTRGVTLKGIGWAFTRFHSFNWHPVTWISHMLDCQFYGLNPGGHHFTNLLLHAATAILLFLVLREMTGFLWRSAFVAAVFAIHPLRVESVAWIAERKDILSGMFFMLTLGAYLRYVRRPWSLARYGLVFLLFALGLMCKPMLVTLPIVMLLLDYWPLNRFQKNTTQRVFRLGDWRVPKHLVFEKLPLFALSIASSIVTFFAQSGAIWSFEQVPLHLRLSNALISYAAYLKQLFWPSGLAVLYPFPPHGGTFAKMILAAIVLVAISVGVFRARNKRPYLLTGWLWYLIMLLPVIGIFQVGAQARADRYTYLPQIGVYWLLTWAIADLCASQRIPRWLPGGCSVAVLAPLIFCARIQASYWRDSESLWIHTLACTSDNFIAENNLGFALLAKGDVNGAITHCERALSIRPNYADAYNNLGSAFLEQGNADEAMLQCQKALQFNPNLAEAHNNLGNALLRKGRADEAMAQFQSALRLTPDSAEARNNLGNALLQQGKTDEALVQLQLALRLKPDSPEALGNLGNVLLLAGKTDAAIADFRKSLQIKPTSAEGHYNFGNALLQTGSVDEALAQYQEALRLRPNYAEAHNNLGSALLRKGSVDEATVHFKKALDLNPNYADAHYDLASVLLQKGETGEALAHYRKAFQINPHDSDIQNSLAWVLATASRKSLRNGSEAVELAQRANQLTGGKSPVILRTLAAAYAEAGQFSNAMQTARAAIKAAEAASQPDLVTQLSSDLKLYQAGLPFPTGSD